MLFAPHRQQCRKDVLASLNEAEKTKKPAISQLFSDVYHEVPDHLKEQYKELQGRDHHLLLFLILLLRLMDCVRRAFG